MKEVGHNSGPTQKQTCHCESIKELIQKTVKISSQFENNAEILRKKESIENSWT